jgi:hypothetical protein
MILLIKLIDSNSQDTYTLQFEKKQLSEKPWINNRQSLFLTKKMKNYSVQDK